MKKLWLAYCPHCKKAVTGCPAPHTMDFVRRVNCVLCNEEIDASKGRYVFAPIVIKPETIDLLRVK